MRACRLYPLLGLWLLLTVACGAGPSPGADVDRRLREAAAVGDVEEVRSQLRAGADVHATDDQGRTALIVAAYGAHVETAQVLIDAGADVNAKDETTQSAYLIATSEIGPGPGLDLLRRTLARGADVRSLDRYQGTGLIRAADRGFADIVSELIRAGVPIDHVNNLGWTALLEAIILGGGDAEHVEVVRRLVDAGADVNLPDGEGTTPLAHARANGYSAMVDVLQRAGGR